jgi:hypothetical protein
MEILRGGGIPWLPPPLNKSLYMYLYISMHVYCGCACIVLYQCTSVPEYDALVLVGNELVALSY